MGLFAVWWGRWDFNISLFSFILSSFIILLFPLIYAILRMFYAEEYASKKIEKGVCQSYAIVLYYPCNCSLNIELTTM